MDEPSRLTSSRLFLPLLGTAQLMRSVIPTPREPKQIVAAPRGAATLDVRLRPSKEVVPERFSIHRMDVEGVTAAASRANENIEALSRTHHRVDPLCVIFDIETTDLSGDNGRMLCCTIKRLDGKHLHTTSPGSPHAPVTYSLLDEMGRWKRNPRDDSVLVRKVAEALNSYHVLIGQYVLFFDLPFIRARIAYWNALGKNIPQLLPDNGRVADTFKMMYPLKSNRFQGRSMKAQVELFSLRRKKREIPRSIWEDAQAGLTGPLRKIISRCESDVLITEEMYIHNRPHCRPNSHPDLNLIANTLDRCRVCLGNTAADGNRFTASGKFEGYSCTSCGYKMRSPKAVFRSEVR